MSICLENKYFDEIYSSEESQSNNYVYWLQYLYDYLSVDLRNKEWAQEMLVLLEEEQFLSENKNYETILYTNVTAGLDGRDGICSGRNALL